MFQGPARAGELAAWRQVTRYLRVQVRAGHFPICQSPQVRPVRDDGARVRVPYRTSTRVGTPRHQRAAARAYSPLA